tara:strand:+ start:1269 stop:1490 length:222 start_codon:yes stop_codon:yes gene_type:complete
LKELLNGEGVKMKILEEIDEVARKWNQTKKLKYKTKWYLLIKEFADGTYYPERWNVSSSTNNKTDARRNIFSR